MAVRKLPIAVENSIKHILTQHGFGSYSAIIVTSSESCAVSENFKVTVTTQEHKEFSFFVKSLPKNKCNYSLDTEKYFNNEIVFYGETVKLFLELENTRIKHINLSLMCIPKCFDIGQQDESFIIMEDLMKRGYQSLGLKEPLSLKCVRKVLTQLGKFHAYSFAVKDQNPQLFTYATSKLEETCFHQNIQETYRKLFLHAMHDALKLVKLSLPQESFYIKKFAEFVLDIFNKMILLANGDDEDKPFRVITHGDLWPINMLYKFSNDNNEEPDNVVFVDFQGCRYSSPVHDVILVLLVSIDQCTREQHREELIRTYHTSLCETLEQLGSDPLRLFPYLALQSQIRKHARFALAMALAGLPIHLDEGPQHADLETQLKPNINPEDTLNISIQSIYSRKTMKCKNKMLEILMEAVNQEWL